MIRVLCLRFLFQSPVCGRYRKVLSCRYHSMSLRLSFAVIICFSLLQNATRMRAHKIDRERTMCPSCVLINHATRDSSVRDELRPPALFPVDGIVAATGNQFLSLIPWNQQARGREGSTKCQPIDRRQTRFGRK